MELVPWRSFRDIISFRDQINKMFDEFFGKIHKAELPTELEVWSPLVDIYETEDAVIVTAELPGMNKDQISISVTENTLTIKGERKYASEIKKENYQRVERAYGNFQRVIPLPSTVDTQQAKANYKDGILEIKIPKIEKIKPKEIEIE